MILPLFNFLYCRKMEIVHVFFKRVYRMTSCHDITIFYFRCTDAATSYKSGNFTMITLHPTRNMSYLESGILEEKNDPCFYQMKVSDNNKTVFKEFQCKKWMYSHPHGKAKTWSDQVCFLNQLSARSFKKVKLCCALL